MKLIYPENWVIISLASRWFWISKLPHSVFKPCMLRSREYSLKNVVFPLPVGPVNIVNSPALCPFNISFSIWNLFHFFFKYLKKYEKKIFVFFWRLKKLAKYIFSLLLDHQVYLDSRILARVYGTIVDALFKFIESDNCVVFQWESLSLNDFQQVFF